MKIIIIFAIVAIAFPLHAESKYSGFYVVGPAPGESGELGEVPDLISLFTVELNDGKGVFRAHGEMKGEGWKVEMPIVYDEKSLVVTSSSTSPAFDMTKMIFEILSTDAMPTVEVKPSVEGTNHQIFDSLALSGWLIELNRPYLSSKAQLTRSLDGTVLNYLSLHSNLSEDPAGKESGPMAMTEWKQRDDKIARLGLRALSAMPIQSESIKDLKASFAKAYGFLRHFYKVNDWPMKTYVTVCSIVVHDQ